MVCRLLYPDSSFASLRWAELAALRPEDIDLEACTVRITRQLHYHQAGYSFGPPKSRAGRRVVAFPSLITPDLRKHLEALPHDASLVFIRTTGTPLAHSNFRRRVWLPALETAGLPGVHFHDLRHTGNQLTEVSGVAAAASFGGSVNARYLQCSVRPWSKLGATGAHAPCVTWDAIIRLHQAVR